MWSVGQALRVRGLSPSTKIAAGRDSSISAWFSRRVSAPGGDQRTAHRGGPAPPPPPPAGTGGPTFRSPFSEGSYHRRGGRGGGVPWKIGNLVGGRRSTPPLKNHPTWGGGGKPSRIGRGARGGWGGDQAAAIPDGITFELAREAVLAVKLNAKRLPRALPPSRDPNIGFSETTGEPMHDAALGSQDSAPAIGGFSLGAKFVGLTAGLILLLSLTAFISLRNSAETVRQMGSVVEFAIPAYGALARSHIRSLEQAVELRRSLLLAQDPAVADDAIAEHVQAFRKAQAEFHREVADAERLLERQRDSTSSATVAADLQRLTEALTGLRPLTENYEKETAACLAAISARALPEARRRLVTIDGLRQQLGERLETMRAGMFATLKVISKEAQDAEARARVATIVVFVLSSILGLGVAALGAMRVIRSIKSLVLGAEAVEGGNLDTRIQIASRDEIGRLAASFNRMTEGLRMRDRIRETFGRYVDRRIAEQLIGSHNLLGRTRRAPRRRRHVLRPRRIRGLERARRGRAAGALPECLFSMTRPGDRGHRGDHRQVHRRCGHGLLVPALRAARRGGAAQRRCRPALSAPGTGHHRLQPARSSAAAPGL